MVRYRLVLLSIVTFLYVLVATDFASTVTLSSQTRNRERNRIALLMRFRITPVVDKDLFT